jgi:type IV pilus assembly protein PilC
MLFPQQADNKSIADFSRRMAMSLEAGIDVRKALTSEANRSSRKLKPRIEQIRDDAAQGRPLAEAFKRSGNYFPPLVLELVAVGEQTGHLPEVLHRLSSHYEEQIKLRRTFVSAITWPLVQFGMALFVVGLLIWISGVIGGKDNKSLDLLGLGLRGDSGLAIYLTFLAVMFGAIFFVYRAIAAGKLWVAPIQRLALRLPVIGSALTTLAVSRFAWTLHLTMSVAIEVKRAMTFSLASTHNAEFTSKIPQVEAAISRGDSIYEALDATGVFPIELIHAVQVGEESGRLVESLEVIARQQLEEARRALAILTRAAGYLIWCLVAGFIIVLIFRLFSSYLHMYDQFLPGPGKR